MHQDAIIYILLSKIFFFNFFFSLEEANLFKYSYILKKFVKEIETTLGFNYENENRGLEYHKIIDLICIRRKFKR